MKLKKILLPGLLLAVLCSELTGLNAEPSGEQVLEECLLEANKKGYDIESDAFTSKVADAIANEDSATMKKICPLTFKKYN